MASFVLALVECGVLRADPRLAGLPHVADQLSSLLLGRPLALLPKAAAHGSLALFDRLVARVQRDSPGDPGTSAFWFGRALEAAIRHDNLSMIQRIHTVHPQPFDVRTLALALQYGTLETVQWIVENRCDRLCCPPGIQNLCSSCLYSAIPECGMRDARRIVPWLFASGFAFGTSLEDPNPSATAVLLELMRGDGELVLWLETNGHLREKHVKAFLRHAIESGPPHAAQAVRMLLERGHTLKEVEVVDSLLVGCCRPELEPVLDVVVSSRLCDSLRHKFVYSPMRCGGRKVLQWSKDFLESHGRNRPNNAKAKLRQNALRFGHDDMARWLVKERGLVPAACLPADCSEQDALCQYATMGELGIPAATSDSQLAASRGFLEVLKRLPSDNDASRLMDLAAGNGHLQVVQWLLHANQGDVCMDKALVHAARHGHLPVVQWLAQRQPDGDTSEAFAQAAVQGHLDIAEWLFDNRPPCCIACVISRVTHSTDSVSPRLSLRWLNRFVSRSRPCTCPSVSASFGSVVIAADNGDLHYLQDLDETTRAVTAQHVAEIAARRGHAGILRWLSASHVEAVDWAKVRTDLSLPHRAVASTI